MSETRRNFILTAGAVLATPSLVLATPTSFEDFSAVLGGGKQGDNNSKISVAVSLALATDGSMSVNDEEFSLQNRGTAEALRSARVINAILELKKVHVFATQFSRVSEQTLPHTLLETEEDILKFADSVELQARVKREGTNIADCIGNVCVMMSEAPYVANRRVLDICGDGEMTTNETVTFDEGQRQRLRDIYSPLVRDASWSAAMAHSVQINGLAICTDWRDLDEYYLDTVVTRADAWELNAVRPGKVWSVSTYEHFGEAMASKLENELLGKAVPHDQTPDSGLIYRYS